MHGPAPGLEIARLRSVDLVDGRLPRLEILAVVAGRARLCELRAELAGPPVGLAAGLADPVRAAPKGPVGGRSAGHPERATCRGGACG